MSKTLSFWPQDLRPSDIKTPEAILGEQARSLADMTGGVLRAAVEPGSHAEWVTLDFFIVVPRLDDYAYRLFKVRHKLPDPFNPLEIIVTAKDIRRAKSRAEFDHELANILGSASTRSLLAELLSLSNGAPVD